MKTRRCLAQFLTRSSVGKYINHCLKRANVKIGKLINTE